MIHIIEFCQRPGLHRAIRRRQLADDIFQQRGFPVERVYVDFTGPVRVYPEIFEDIRNADILIMAPGSLYSSIIPIFHVPGLAEAVRENNHALKLLISNLWVQAGETDRSIEDPERKFHVSDMLRAYERNIPGGTEGLFHEVLCLSLKDVPASILQQYEVEGKIPIYLDRNIVCEQGFIPIECGIYSKAALAERGVIQHDPEIVAQAIKTIFIGSVCYPGKPPERQKKNRPVSIPDAEKFTNTVLLPSLKFKKLLTVLKRYQLSLTGVKTQPSIVKKFALQSVISSGNIRIYHLTIWTILLRSGVSPTVNGGGIKNGTMSFLFSIPRIVRSKFDMTRLRMSGDSKPHF